MKAILTNFGTTGDVLPFISLALEMRQAGHQAILAFSPYHQSWIESYGLDFVPIGPDLQYIQRDAIQTLLTEANTVENLHSMYAPLTSNLPQIFRELRDICHEADVLVSGPVQPAGRMVHELTGMPFVSVQLDHLGGGGRPVFQQATATLINPFRVKMGLPPLRNPLTSDANSPQLAIYAMSPHVIPRPINWPSHYHMTGYFFHDDEKWQAGSELLEFLAGGGPPVVMTLGSTVYCNSDELTNLLLSAIKIAGCRAIIQRGWAGLGGEKEMPPNVLTVEYVPHSWLFPRASCIIHHGGVGTSAAAFRAGIPSIFITHGAPIRAALAQELGCAGPHIPFWELTPERLGSAIKTVINSTSYYIAAASLGAKIRAERGVVMARKLIEACA